MSTTTSTTTTAAAPANFEVSSNPKPAIHDEAGLLESAEQHNTKPLWKQMTRLNPPAPNPKTVPHIWRYDEIRPTLLKAGELVSESQAERRVLMLVNPARDAPFTTDTLYAGLQLVMPNEVARAHRHTAFAMRFIVEGQGGFTAVQGQRITMQRGDVILTPTWNWHDHGKDGDGPMIWLDGLDLPNFMHFPVHFVEHHTAARYPAESVDSNTSPIVFPWVRMQKQLDDDTAAWTSKDYVRENGEAVSKILGGSAERLNSGTTSPVVQETASSVYHVITGKGSSDIGGKIIEWKQGDTFCVPAWHRYSHTASESGSPVYLYRFHDKPMLKALGFYRSIDDEAGKWA